MAFTNKKNPPLAECPFFYRSESSSRRGVRNLMKKKGCLMRGFLVFATTGFPRAQTTPLRTRRVLFGAHFDFWMPNHTMLILVVA